MITDDEVMRILERADPARVEDDIPIDAAGDLDVRIGGGASTVNAYVAADLVDHLHLAVVPVVLGRGTSLWQGLEALEDTFHIESVTSPSGVTHLSLTRRSDAAA